MIYKHCGEVIDVFKVPLSTLDFVFLCYPLSVGHSMTRDLKKKKKKVNKIHVYALLT